MNKLEKYRDKTNIWVTSEARGGYELGFNACLALDLPVKFLAWLKEREFLGDFTFWEGKIWFRGGKIKLPSAWVTEKELFEYWIDNIYKSE